MAGTRHNINHRGPGRRAPRRERLIRGAPALALTGQTGHPSWPAAAPTVALPRAIARRQARAAARLERLGGAASYLRREREAFS